jgi:hypothetical protein
MRHKTIFPALAAALLIAGCGSSASNSSNDPDSAQSSAQSSGILFAGCMRSHGVPNFPDPKSGTGGGLQIQSSQRNGQGQTMTVNGVPVSAPAFQSAMKVCQKDMPKAKPIAGGLTQLRANALKYGECMRANGVPNFPDPTVRGGSGGAVSVQMNGAGINPQSPAVEAAQKKCHSIMGLPGGGPGAAPSPSSQVPSGGSSGSG